MRVLRSVLFLAGLGLSQVSWAQESGLQAAVRLVGEGRYAAALEAGRGQSDPLARAQAELYALHQAGALDDALRAGLRGLETAPRDPWLLERSAYIALSLGAGELAEELYLSLQTISPAEEWQRTGPLLEEARALVRRREAERSALLRARVAALGALLACLAPMLLWIRGGRSE